MATHNSIQSCLHRSPRGAAELYIRSMTAVLVVLAIVVCIEVSIPTTSSRAEAAGEIVNRLHKVDRLPLPSHAPIVDLKLLTGCESLVSPLADASLANVAGRCVS